MARQSRRTPRSLHAASLPTPRRFLASTARRTAGLAGLLLAALPFAAAAHAQGYTYVTVDDPSADTSFYASPEWINTSGQIVGNYRDASNVQHGYLYSGGTFTTIDDPSGVAGSTVVAAINDAGQVVGNYSDSSGYRHSFQLSAGVYSTLTSTSAPNAFATAINNDDQIVGYDWIGPGDASNPITSGYLEAGGAFSAIDDPSGAKGTAPVAINATGEIVGYYYDSNGLWHGFLYNGGTYTTIDDPNGDPAKGGTYPLSINASGQIVGYYYDSNYGEHGFLYSSGAFTTLNDPAGAADTTAAEAINASGTVVGTYSDSKGVYHGFVYSGGAFTAITDPNAVSTEGTFAVSINASGQVVGYYFDSSGKYHGYVATPVAAPKISGFTPASGAVGTAVTISGTSLANASAVTFAGTKATITGDTATSVTATVPSGATTGKIAVTTPGGTATSATSFTVLPLEIKTLTLSPASIAPGASTAATITLDGNALSGGAAVSLLLNGFPFTTVTVPAGQSSVTHTIATGSTVPSGTYTLKASYGGASASATLTISQAVGLKSFAFSPSTVKRGNASTGTVTLTAAAPSGGETVSILYAGFPLVNVAIGAGKTSGTFSLSTDAAMTAGTYSFAAVLGDATAPANLVVTD
jgi:probable HAF family extracellular repeat protein